MTSSHQPMVRSFVENVILTFDVAVAGQHFSYLEYMSLSRMARANDEADVVDVRFAQGLLKWLSFEKDKGQYTYNRSTRGAGNSITKPDFVAYGPVGTAFVLEDQNTADEDIDEDHLLRLRKYVAGTAGYAIWTNGRLIRGYRFDALGSHHVAVQVDVIALAHHAASGTPVPQELEDAILLLHLLYSRKRFLDFQELAEALSVDEKIFLEHAQPLDSDAVQRQFVAGASEILGHLRLAALQQIELAVRHRQEASAEEVRLKEQWRLSAATLVERLSMAVSKEARLELQSELFNLENRMGLLREADIAVDPLDSIARGPKVKRLSSADRSAVEEWVQSARKVNSALQRLRLESVGERTISDAYQVWSDRQPFPDLATPTIYAEQIAYVVFVRLLLARILEDKGILERRIVSDGGFSAWLDIIKRYFGSGGTKIHSESFFSLLSESLSRYYHHFFQQPVFDWFIPDDYLLVETLEFLSRYNFRYIDSDLIGFTYERYIDRVAKSKKGHFLTRPEIVKYMLDVSGYSGTGILGRKMLDPACGSGSFLVEALRRYRIALDSAIRARIPGTDGDGLQLELAESTVEAATTLFYGMDTDPFACYLAELNLLIQVLQDIHTLWRYSRGRPIERFMIFNTDSLALPNSVLGRAMQGLGQHDFPRSVADDMIDETFPIKSKANEYASGFWFVLGNPPYINPRQHEFATDYRRSPFFEESLSGVANTYILFLRLGIHYLAQGGTLCFIVPLTVLGDSSASAIRSLLTKDTLNVAAAIRFYTGNVLFPGIDQSTAIIRVVAGSSPDTVVSGAVTVAAARGAERLMPNAMVTQAASSVIPWSPWLVSPDEGAYHVWGIARSLPSTISGLFQGKLSPKQGDVNSGYITPFLGVPDRNRSTIGLYAGEDLLRYSPLGIPSRHLRTDREESGLNSNQRKVRLTIQEFARLAHPQHGIVRRHVQRLNTRKELIATKFLRRPEQTFVFDDGTYRYIANDNVSEKWLDAWLGLINSRVISYLINMFSTNNNVLDELLFALPIPSINSFPIEPLSAYVARVIEVRQQLQVQFVEALKAQLPERGDKLAISPLVSLERSGLPTIKVSDAVLRGLVVVKGDPGKIAVMIRQGRLMFNGEAGFCRAASLIFRSLSEENLGATLAGVRLPEPTIAHSWLTHYEESVNALRASWLNFQDLQRAIDQEVCDWYGFDDAAREAIAAGVPWAARS